MVAPELIHAQGMNLPGSVLQCIMLLHQLRICQVIVRQLHGGKIVVADHGLIGAMHNNLNRQRRILHQPPHLLKGQLQGCRPHDNAVLLQEGGCHVVEKVEGKIRLHRQAGALLGQLQGTQVAYHDA